jgi:hypothetical protein
MRERDSIIFINYDAMKFATYLDNNGWRIKSSGTDYYSNYGRHKGHVKLHFGAYSHYSTNTCTRIRVMAKTPYGGFGYLTRPKELGSYGSHITMRDFMTHIDALISEGPPAQISRPDAPPIVLPEPLEFMPQVTHVKDSILHTNITCISFKLGDVMTIDKTKGELRSAMKPGDEAWFFITGYTMTSYSQYAVSREFITNGEVWHPIKNIYYPSKKKSIPRITKPCSWRPTKADLALIKRLLKESL